jgi:CubicO group peptidase (beta-lactamase class C family)
VKIVISQLFLLLLTLNTFGLQADCSKLYSAIKEADILIETDPRDFFKNVESFIVFNRGNILIEKYYQQVRKDSLHHLQSQTKSIVSLLTGIAIDQGIIKNENEPAARYFPQYFSNKDSLKFQVTIKDLVTMSAGFEWEEMIPFDDPKNDNGRMYRSGHWLEYALSQPMAAKPFARFTNNSGCPMIVAGILEKATRMPLDKFAEKNLFKPLGIESFRWLKDSTGFCHAGGGLYLKPMDMFKIGVMILNEGIYHGNRIVSRDWIKRSLQPYFITEFSNKNYGYFWWIKEMPINKDTTTTVYSAEGAGGQSLFIIPEYDLVISFTEHNYTTPQVGPWVLRESILPNLK